MDAGLKALRRIREDYPDAFLAGGYLRDLVAGVEPKDIDIFTFKPALAAEAPVPPSDANAWYPMGRLTGVSLRSGFDYPVQVIHLNPDSAKTPEEAVAQFALGIQQIYYVNDVAALRPFAADMQGKTFTVTRCDSSGEAWSIGRKLFRLKDKFPGFTLAIPPQFAEHAHTIEYFMQGGDTTEQLELVP